MTCPRCGAPVSATYISPVDPARDRFQCLPCDYAFPRYAGTIYETPEERAARLREERHRSI